MPDYMANARSLIGQNFNRLELIDVLEVTSLSGQIYGYFRCQCGTEKTIGLSKVTTAEIRSCGCLRTEYQKNHLGTNTTHGMSGTPEHRAWLHMIDRCSNQNCPKWIDYGGRGITVHEPWLDFAVFFAYVGKRPSAKHSIDRFPDNDGNYEPGNVRWATAKEQANNKKRKVPKARKAKTV